MPMNRWYVSRMLMPTTVDHFCTAVGGLRHDLEKLTGEKYDLKISFYRAARPMDPHEGFKDKPDVLVETLTSLSDLTVRKYRRADYVEAILTPRQNPERKEPLKAEWAKVSARWPDIRQIDFHVEPAAHGREICRNFLDAQRFLLWTRGIA